MFKQHIESYKENIISDLIELMDIRTIEGDKKPNMPFGEDVYRGLKYVMDKGDSWGLKNQIFCGYCGQIDAGDGDYIVSILCHVDVTAEDNKCTTDPFRCEVRNDNIYGKGAVSGKGQLIACLYAMKLLEEEKLIPQGKKIRLIIGTDKETGGKSIDYYKEYGIISDIGFTPDGVFPVVYGEKGIIDIDLNMVFKSKVDAPINIVQIVGGDDSKIVPSKSTLILSCTEGFREKIEMELKVFSEDNNIEYNIFTQNKLMAIEFIGKQSQGHTPEKGVNAISYSIEFLFIFQDFIDKKEFISEYHRLISTSYYGENIGCSIQDEDSGKLTFNVGLINLNNDEVNIKVNITYPISYIYSDVFQLIKSGFKYSELKVKNISHIRSISFSRDSFLVKKLMKAYKSVTGDKVSREYCIPEKTYARSLGNTVSFGPRFPGNQEYFEACDEHISINSLMKITDIYATAMYELLK
ncbi:MAG: Sapep family Mn(2+)-dependent dipeptidase [Clostridium sp.]|uniref:Sapep family Mn(2+)-dependent dipeptidase n=1 Tax=Clostridium sp. TaxID=1506 RepID=UPI003034A96F